jgi:secondary thiamine-phosphate synthase enzyme
MPTGSRPLVAMRCEQVVTVPDDIDDVEAHGPVPGSTSPLSIGQHVGQHAGQLAGQLDAAPLRVCSRLLLVHTRLPTEFVDVTCLIEAAVREAGLATGAVTVHTRHTTTGLLVNEHEPLLLVDLQTLFERLAPTTAAYAHDDFERRTVNLAPGERRNGHAHCRAALLRSSETLALRRGRLYLGRWQRVFLAEFDGPQRRELLLTMMGTCATATSPP